MPTIGKLRAQLGFQRRVEAGDGYGNDQAEFADLGFTRRAQANPTRGGEEIIAQRLTGTASWDIWVRSDSETRTLQPGDRAIDTRDPARIFNIRWIGDMDGRGRFLLIQADTGRLT